jgi:DNA-directed RNA polymerase subunit RPC12/RpoP
MLDCRDCGRTFDLAAQNYYDQVCPECVDDERTWPLCFKCSERVGPEDRTPIKVTGGLMDNDTAKVPAHEECAADHTPPGNVRP